MGITQTAGDVASGLNVFNEMVQRDVPAWNATITNQMKANGEVMIEVVIVEKIIRTLTQRYNHIVVAIEESKNLDTMKLEDLQSSLEAHELRHGGGEKGNHIADDNTITAEGVGKILIQIRDGKKYFICDVLYVPNMKNNLLSLEQLLEKGYSMNMENEKIKMFDSANRLILKEPLSKNRTFKIEIQINEN
ncbi:uncharacterized protein [Cicer arietinum]|uniref:Uncharacterized protein LOC101491709 n=1 Tax=Cicer arietinum TaxID=3827 RepID=A0A1S2XEM2_CICAR|nr:uncharacterized protein LOC101491709 [Cicer arietinum]